MSRDSDSTGAATAERRRGRPRSQEAHQAILNATLETLGERGFDGLTFEAVASRAGVGRPTIYRRWKRKEDLVAEAIEYWRPRFAVVDTGSLGRDLEAMVDGIDRALTDRSVRRLWLVVLTQVSLTDSLREAWWSAYVAPRFEMIRPVFQRAVARGELDSSTDIDRLMMLLSAAMMYHYVMLPERRAKDEVWRSIDFLVGRARDHGHGAGRGATPASGRVALRRQRPATRSRARAGV